MRISLRKVCELMQHSDFLLDVLFLVVIIAVLLIIVAILFVVLLPRIFGLLWFVFFIWSLF